MERVDANAYQLLDGTIIMLQPGEYIVREPLRDPMAYSQPASGVHINPSYLSKQYYEKPKSNGIVCLILLMLKILLCSIKDSKLHWRHRMQRTSSRIYS